MLDYLEAPSWFDWYRYLSERFGEDFDFDSSEAYCRGYDNGYEELGEESGFEAGSDEDCLYEYGCSVGFMSS